MLILLGMHDAVCVLSLSGSKQCYDANSAGDICRGRCHAMIVDAMLHDAMSGELTDSTLDNGVISPRS